MRLSSPQSARTVGARWEHSLPRPGRILHLLSIAAIFLAVLRAASAGQTTKQSFDLPADNAEVALLRFGEQAGKQVIFPTDLVKGIRTNAVRGQFGALEALELMLARTSLRATEDSATGALAIIREAPPPPSRRAGSDAVGSLASPSAKPNPQQTEMKMTKIRTVLASLAAFFTVAGQAQTGPTQTPDATASPAQVQSNEAVKLPAFNVTSTNADPYHATDVMSIARVAGESLDQPFTVNVVTKQLLTDLDAGDGFDANRYFAGISQGRSSGANGINDRQNFRGFEGLSRTVDDFASSSSANFDPLFEERAELVMGPDSILAPSGTAGGSINVITKTPEFTEGTDFTVEVGNYYANRWTLDTTGPLSPHFAYRVMLDYQDAATYVPGALRQKNLGLEFTYKFSDSTKLTFKYFGQQLELRGASLYPSDQVYQPNTVGGVTISNTFEPGFSPDGYNGVANWSRRDEWFNVGELEFTTTLFKLVSMRLAVQGMTDNFTLDTAVPLGAPAETFDPATGINTGVITSYAMTAMPEVGVYNHNFVREAQVQNDYAANFHFSGVSLLSIAGWAWTQSHTIYGLAADDTNTSDFPPVDLLVDKGYYAPPDPSLADYTFGRSNSPTISTLNQGYCTLRAGFFGDRLFATGGVARSWADVDNYKSTSFVTTADGFQPQLPYSHVALISEKDNSLIGMVAKPATNVSLYGIVATNASLTTSPTNTPLWQSGKEFEFGVKTEFLDKRLALSADHFQITEDNLSSPNPAYNTNSSLPPTILIDATSHGFEFNAVGTVTKNLSIIASYTVMQYRDGFGRRVRNVPDVMANLLANYHFTTGVLKNANVFLAVCHSGQAAGETETGFTSLGVPEQPGFYISGYTVLNAGAGYRWGRYHFNLNLDNALNSHSIWEATSRTEQSAYQGLTVRFAVAVHI